MKPTARLRSFLLLASSTLFAITAASGQVYWDNNGTPTGFGTAGGTWGTSNFWNNASNGGAGTFSTVTTTSSAVNFGSTTHSLGAGTISVGTVDSGSMTFAAGSGAIVLSGGTITLAAAPTITVNNATNTINSILSGAGTSLTKAGLGALVLTGASNYAGSTIINAGTLDLGGGTANGSLASTVLTLGGGSLSYTRTGTNTQSFTTTNINTRSANSITGASGNTLNLGTVNRGVGATLNFSATGLGIIAADSSNNDSTGIMAGFTHGNSWAVANGADVAISALADGSYTQTSSALNTAGNYTGFNIDVNSSQAPDAAITANSLRFSSTAANTLTLQGANVITSGGILVGSGVGSNLSTITGGTLAGAASKDLSIIQNNTSGGLSISSIIANNTGATGLTKSGAGLLTLSNNNTYTGATSIIGGTLSVSSDGNLGTAPGSATAGHLVINGGTLSASSTFTLSTNRGIALGSANTSTGGTMDVAASQTLTYGGIIANNGGANSLTKTGAGTLTLSGANTYTGATTISEGTLRLDGIAFTTQGRSYVISSGAVLQLNGLSGNTVPNGATAITGSGTFRIANGSTLTSNLSTPRISFNMGSSGLIDIQSGGTIYNGGWNAYTWTGNQATLNVDGTFEIADANAIVGALTGSGSVISAINFGAVATHTLTLGAGDATGTFSGNMTNTGNRIFALTKTGTGTQIFTGSVSYKGATTISGGTLQLGNGGTTGALTTASSVTAITNNANLTINRSNDFTQATDLGGRAVGGSGSFTQAGAGTTTLSLANTYSGITSITGGALSISSDGNLGTAPGSAGVGRIVINGGALSASASFTLNSNRGIALGSSTASTGGTMDVAASQTLTYGGIIANNGGANSLTKIGNGTLTLSGQNTYTGGTRIDVGTLTLGHATNTLANTGAVNVNGGTLALGTNTDTVGAVTLTSGSITGSGAGTLTGTSYDVRSGTISAKLGGSGVALTKTTDGTVTISSDNSVGGYTGATAVNDGTLIVNGNISTSILTTVESGATLGGTGTVGAATIHGILAPGNSIGTLNAVGDVTWNANDAWVFELGSAASTLALANTTPGLSDLLNITGAGNDFLKGTGSSFTFNFAGGGEVGWYKLVDWTSATTFVDTDFFATSLSSGLTGEFTVDSTTSALYLNVIPEPNVAGLLGGLGTLMLLRRRR
jgi:autotransporter-associated beta strand protein